MQKDGWESDEDSVLWVELKSGRQEALEALFKRHNLHLFNYGINIVSDRELVKDAVQKVFLTLWRRRGQLAEARSVKAYLLSSVRRAIFEKMKRRKRRAKRNQTYLDEKSEFAFSIEDRLIQEEVSAERTEKLKNALRELTPARRRRCIYAFTTGSPTGMSYLSAEVEGNSGSIGSIVFRAVEAYLNYIEASYLKEGSLNGKADQYWRAIRERAGINPNYMVTVNATDMQEEAEKDFAAYSAGELLSDKVLYNIRRERRSELMAEGMRYFDLKRWRALDQLKNDPHIVEGFKLWGPMQNWYDAGELVEPGEGGTPNVSSSAESDYLRPYRINLSDGNHVRNGYSWAYAHYLDPIAVEHFSITAGEESSNLESSIIYQNPGWPLQANAGAEQ
ncbi:sigma-70 family RNA polymerase sigma factor [Halalkalibaculum sp. DA384]|uniref:sigma-70 family RNA polymerase sigma factor n=1 Tax=Halalkalibaculum sp. DA384 TaxID=3373606 RepID=UPI0037552B5A